MPNQHENSEGFQGFFNEKIGVFQGFFNDKIGDLRELF